MRRTLVAVLVLTAAVCCPPDGGLGVRAGVEPGAELDAAVAPLARIIVVVPDPDGAGTMPSEADLGTRLHLADPDAIQVVMSGGPETQVVGPFQVSAGVASGRGLATTVRVETATGPTFTTRLRATPAIDGHLAIVEVLGGPDGIRAWRSADLIHSSAELRLPAWQPPAPGADAVALDGAWWSLTPGAAARATVTGLTGAAEVLEEIGARLARTPVSGLERLVDASVGDVTGDGQVDLALAFRRPFQRTLLNVSRPRAAWMDRDGRSAHVGLFRPGDLSSIWVAGTLVRPVRRLAACTGALAVAYSTLRRPTIVAATAWAWQGFGFLPLPELSGSGRPTCIDIDLDGRPDAAIVGRS